MRAQKGLQNVHFVGHCELNFSFSFFSFRNAMKFRVPIKSLLALFGLIFILVYAAQFYRVNVTQELKSRRGRLEILEEEKPSDLKCKNANENLHAFYYPWYGTPEVDGLGSSK